MKTKLIMTRRELMRALMTTLATMPVLRQITITEPPPAEITEIDWSFYAGGNPWDGMQVGDLITVVGDEWEPTYEGGQILRILKFSDNGNTVTVAQG